MKKLFTLIFAFQLIVFPMPKAQASGIGGMANQLRGIAIASIAVQALMACKLGAMATSLKIFMGAGLVYVAGELTAGKSQKGSIESENSKMDSSLGGRGGETQLASMEAQLKDKKEKKKVADKRATFTAASMALMTAAAVVAITEIATEKPPILKPPPFLGCEGATAIAKGNLTATSIVAGFTFLTGGGLMGAMMAGISMYMNALGFMMVAMNTAAGRAKVFGALAALTGLAMMDAKKESSKLAKEIKQLEEMIAQFKKETGDPGDQKEDTTAGAAGGATSGSDGGVLAGVTSGSSSGSTSGAGPGTLTALPAGAQNVGGSKVCVTATGPSSNCANSLRVPALDFNGLGTGPELQQVASQGVELGNSIASGNAGAEANVSAASIGSSAAKINSELKKQLGRANATLKAEGKKAMDFDKEVADTLKSFNSAVDAQASKSPQLAAFGSTGATLDPNAAAKEAQDITAASSGAAVAVPTSKGDAASAVDPSLSANTAMNSEEMKAAGESAKDALGNNLSDYESTEEDISKNKEDSLWKQVSNRYLLNYQRFFERSKGPAPAQ